MVPVETRSVKALLLALDYATHAILIERPAPLHHFSGAKRTVHCARARNYTGTRNYGASDDKETEWSSAVCPLRDMHTRTTLRRVTRVHDLLFSFGHRVCV